MTYSVRNHEPVTAARGTPASSRAAPTRGNRASTNVLSTAWSTADASIVFP